MPVRKAAKKHESIKSFKLPFRPAPKPGRFNLTPNKLTRPVNIPQAAKVTKPAVRRAPPLAKRILRSTGKITKRNVFLPQPKSPRARKAKAILDKALEKEANTPTRARIALQAGVPPYVLVSDEDDRETKLQNEKIRTDPALWKLVLANTGRSIRQKSIINPGFWAEKAERDEMSKAAAMQRELTRLRVDGTAALHYGLPRTAVKADDPFFDVPDCSYGEKPSRGRLAALTKAERQNAAKVAENNPFLRPIKAADTRVQKKSAAKPGPARKRKLKTAPEVSAS